MLRVGLSGGIGSGKSSVAQRLVDRGALLIDSDVVAREVVEPGTPGLERIRERFGEEVLDADGALDRAKLASVVFDDDAARADLNAIVHPLVYEQTQRWFEDAPLDAVVVHDIPLLVELERGGEYHLTVIVDAPEEVRVQRLVEQRGMSEQDARARIRAQADDDARRAAADVLLPNTGSTEELDAAVDQLWEERLLPFDENLMADRRVPRPTDASLADADPKWAEAAARLVGRMRTQLDRSGVADQVVAVEHIGSTAVPGLAAKDVIDLQIRVRDLAVTRDLDFARALRLSGVVHGRPTEDTPHDLGRADLSPEAWEKVLYGGADPALVVHVHVRQEDSPAAWLALAFRDWLRANPQEQQEYLAAKHAAIEASTPGDRSSYPAAKESWFKDHVPRVREWAEQTGWSPQS